MSHVSHSRHRPKYREITTQKTKGRAIVVTRNEEVKNARDRFGFGD